MNRKELKSAFEEGIISKEQYSERLLELELTKPKEKKFKRIYEPLNEEQFISLLEHTKNRRHRIAFILAYGSGLRISEVNHLKAEDISLKEHKIFIRQAKGNKDRLVNTPRWLKEKHLRFLPLELTERTLSWAFLSASIRAGFNSVIYTDHAKRPRYKYHFHSLRHSYATRLLDKGVPIHQVQILMGHENLSTTARYVKSNPTDAIASVFEKDI